MATKPYTLSDLRMIAPRYRSAAGTEMLSIRVWNGSCLLGINLDKTPKPIFNKHWKINELFVIVRYMSDFAKAEPNTDKTLVINTYNRIEKKKVMDYVLIFRKDERKIFHIIIKSNGQTYDFPIRGVADICFGTGDIAEEERSLNEWMYLINFLRNMVPLQMQLTAFPIENPNGQNPNGQGGGPGGGYNRGGYNRGNYNRGGQGGPQQGGNGQGGGYPSNDRLPPDDDIFG